MSMFTFSISCLTISNLSWLMDLTFQVPMQYCSYSIWLYFHYQSHPQLGVVLLWFHLFILFGVISLIFSSSILGTYWPGEFIFQCHTFSPFHTIHGVLKTRILKSFAIRFTTGPRFVITPCQDLTWVALHGIAHSFIELDTAVFPVISLVNFLWLWFSFCLPSDGEG